MAVVFDLRVRAALPLVMLVADIAALAALYLVPIPVINLMGGIPEQQAIAFPALLVTALCWLTLPMPLWILLAGIAEHSPRNRPSWQVPATPDRPGGRRGPWPARYWLLPSGLRYFPSPSPSNAWPTRSSRSIGATGPPRPWP